MRIPRSEFIRQIWNKKIVLFLLSIEDNILKTFLYYNFQCLQGKYLKLRNNHELNPHLDQDPRKYESRFRIDIKMNLSTRQIKLKLSKTDSGQLFMT